MTDLKPCPECGNPDELALDSSSHARASWIDCHWCDFRFQKDCPEETLTRKWNKLDRTNMPEFDLEEELAKLEAEESKHD